METIYELLHNMGQSTIQGWFGVSGIYFYMTVIVVTALYRIRKGDHLHH